LENFRQSRGHGSPWAHQSGIRCGTCGRRSSGSAYDRCRWSCDAWPSRSSCLLFKTYVSYCLFQEQVVNRTFADLSGRVTAVGTGVLLDVQRSLSCLWMKHVSYNCFFVFSLPFFSKTSTENVFRLISLLQTSKSKSEKVCTNRIVDKACASCCDAYRSWRFPSL